MPSFVCRKCEKNISQSDKICPHCETKISILHKILYKIENSRLNFIILVLMAVFLLGMAWYLRMETGQKWIIYVVMIVLAPLVPWILKTAYLIAAPINSDEMSEDSDSKSDNK